MKKMMMAAGVAMAGAVGGRGLRPASRPAPLPARRRGPGGGPPPAAAAADQGSEAGRLHGDRQRRQLHRGGRPLRRGPGRHQEPRREDLRRAQRQDQKRHPPAGDRGADHPPPRRPLRQHPAVREPRRAGGRPPAGAARPLQTYVSTATPRPTAPSITYNDRAHHHRRRRDGARRTTGARATRPATPWSTSRRRRSSRAATRWSRSPPTSTIRSAAA